MKIKAIIVDLDKTLLHTDKSISSYTADVLKMSGQRGESVGCNCSPVTCDTGLHANNKV